MTIGPKGDRVSVPATEQRRWAGVVRLLPVAALLAFSLPFGSARAQVPAPPGVELPPGTPNAVSGRVEGYGVRSIVPVVGLGLTADPQGTYGQGDLQINLVPGAIPFQIKGVAATNHPGFVGGAVLFGADGPGPEGTPGYAESYDEQPLSEGGDPYRLRHVEKCTSSPNAYSDACEPAEPEYMMSESTREGVPHQVNEARRGDQFSDGSFITTSDIRPHPDGIVIATISTFASNVLIGPARVGSIKATSTSVWHLSDPSKRTTESICEASDIEPLAPPAAGLPLEGVGGGFSTAPGFDFRDENAALISSGCQGPTLSYTAPNGDSVTYILGAASSQAGSAQVDPFSVPVVPAVPPPPAPAAPPPAPAPATAAPTTGARPAAPATAAPSTAARPTAPTAAAPTAPTTPVASSPQQPVLAATRPAALDPNVPPPPVGCLGMSFPACVGIMTSFTGIVIVGGVWGLRFALVAVQDPMTAVPA